MTTRTLLAALALLAAAPATAQEVWPEPGEGFTWENVGDRPLSAHRFAFDDAGRLWAAAAIEVIRLDDGVWQILDPLRGGDDVLPLGRGDTVLSASGDVSVARSMVARRGRTSPSPTLSCC